LICSPRSSSPSRSGGGGGSISRRRLRCSAPRRVEGGERSGPGRGMSLFRLGREMSEYQNVVGGRLKLKGKALDVKEGGIKKKKKKQHREESSQIGRDELQEGGSSELTTDPNSELIEADKMGEEEGNPHPDYDHLTPAERRYMEQKQKIDMQKLAKVANKSHRDRIQDFNQYLANLSEHYDIPKVGPG